MPTRYLSIMSVVFAVSHHQLVVHSVSPLYGPLSGGTRVTITGQYVDRSTVSAVLIGQHKHNLDASRLYMILSG